MNMARLLPLKVFLFFLTSFICYLIEVEGEMEVPEEQPSSHRLARSMGVDARNMQVMKASFFTEEEAQTGFGKWRSLCSGLSSSCSCMP